MLRSISGGLEGVGVLKEATKMWEKVHLCGKKKAVF